TAAWQATSSCAGRRGAMWRPGCWGVREGAGVDVTALVGRRAEGMRATLSQPRVCCPGLMYEETPRVELTPAAADLLRHLRAAHGPLMFHQSGGCCDGSAPMCYPDGEFHTGDSDVLLAELQVEGVPEPVTFWMSRSQYEAWSHTRLIVDVVA